MTALYTTLTAHGPILVIAALLGAYCAAEYLTKDVCKLCHRERRMSHMKHVVWTGLVCKPSCIIKFTTRCKDCNAITIPGAGQARCPSCWDDKCGPGEDL